MKQALILCILVFPALPPTRAQVKVSETTLTIPASDEGPPDENPNFDVYAEVEDYPYTMRWDIRPTESPHTWRALVLENEYLRCTILPQIGGHIYTCLDKINGKPMFYQNPSFKRAIIAYRGAWSAFGEEFNFPVSHNWVSISPVDWAYSAAPDGSASVTIGNRDRVYGMDWSVEILLHPGSTVLEQRVTLANHSDERHHFFWWNNAGIQVWPDSRVYYPMQFTIDNGAGSIDTWPINSQKKDLSRVSTPNSDFEVFAWGSNEPFMGVYSPHTDSGAVHYADPNQVPAKKFFSWGNDDNATMWRNRLSDNNSAYVEVQSGLFRDQSTYQFLGPRQSLHFTEYWMPVRGIGAITRANLEGVVSLQREPQRDGHVVLKLAFNANHAIPNADISVLDGEQSLYDETASLDPAVTWTHTLPNLAADKAYTFVLKNAQRETLLTHTEGVYNLVPHDQVHTGQQPQPKQGDPTSAADFLASGNDHEIQGDYLNAWDAYRSGLTKFPADAPLLKAAGRLADHLFRFDEAAALLSKATTADPSDPETHYYRAIAEVALDHPAEAHADLDAAQASTSFRAPAGLLLAELLARQHNAPAALKLLEVSCPASTADLRCTEETIALARAANQPDHARTLLADALTRYPTSVFLRNEAAKLNVPTQPGVPDLNHHLAADTTRILGLVRQYNHLGLYADSLDLLTRSYPSVAPEEGEPAAPTPVNDPLLAYYRGYIRAQLGKPATDDYTAASAMPLRYVFPNNADDLLVLRAALAANPSDASAHFLLGTLYFSKGMYDPGIDEWKQAESINPKIPALQACLGRALLEIKTQPAEAATELQRGLEYEPGNPALYLRLNDAMRQTGKTPAQRINMMRTFPDPAHMPEELVRAVYDALNEVGRRQEADDFLAHRYIPAKEGDTPPRPQK